ncbi:MAG TPA: M15 family metallopeptidase [Fimbriimonadales bacterium]|nr:M15 family metallopeptidase [Fimbriimonadales bacterium]
MKNSDEGSYSESGIFQILMSPHAYLHRKVSPNEPVSELRKIKIIECGEPLVDFLEMCPEILWAKPVWNYTREHLLRLSVAERLCKAARNLPKGYRLAVVEGWRPLHIQRRMHLSAYLRWKERHPDWSPAQLKRFTNRFTAPIDKKVPPPHTTGGAVDVRLCDENGNELDMISPYKTGEPRAYPFDAKNLSKEARKNRRILKEVMESAGITNYPSEYWHYSYGDQGWAYRGGHPYAIYGLIEPPGYKPPQGEDVDEPLEFVR